MASSNPMSIEGGRTFLTARGRQKEGGEEMTEWKRTFLRCPTSPPPGDLEDGTNTELRSFSLLVHFRSVKSFMCWSATADKILLVYMYVLVYCSRNGLHTMTFSYFFTQNF